MLDINQLTKHELIDLNHRIIDRLKELEAQTTSGFMKEFSPGDKVTFQPPGEETMTGVIVKKNQKTVSILTDRGHKWNVHPSCLTHQKGERILEAQWSPLPPK